MPPGPRPLCPSVLSVAKLPPCHPAAAWARYAGRMRLAIVYDCLYPYTVGGAERRYRSLVTELARKHSVTYVTRRQWRRGATLDVPAGVRVAAVSGGRRLYTTAGRRRIGPPLRFGWGVFWYLLRHRRELDCVHACSFPYFSL